MESPSSVSGSVFVNVLKFDVLHHIVYPRTRRMFSKKPASKRNHKELNTNPWN